MTNSNRYSSKCGKEAECKLIGSTGWTHTVFVYRIFPSVKKFTAPLIHFLVLERSQEFCQKDNYSLVLTTKLSINPLLMDIGTYGKHSER